MNAFKSIAHMKNAAEFFPSGKIIPRRILKAKHRDSSGVRFGADTWAINTPKGYLCANDSRSTGYCLHISWVKNQALYGSPYTPGGITDWVGNHSISDDEWLDRINKSLEYKAKPPPRP